MADDVGFAGLSPGSVVSGDGETQRLADTDGYDRRIVYNRSARGGNMIVEAFIEGSARSRIRLVQPVSGKVGLAIGVPHESEGG